MTPRQPSSNPKASPGSPSPGELVFLAVGRLGRPHGLDGAILMQVLTDFPERLKPGVVLYVGPDHQPMRLRAVHWHQLALLVWFEGCLDRDQADLLRDHLVQVRADDRPALPEGEYYHHQLIGLQVRDEAGGEIGQLAEILETGANDVYIVRQPAGGEVLIPAIDSVILGVDLAGGEMRVHLLPGLLPEA